MKKSKNPDLKTLTEQFDHLLLQIIYNDLKTMRFQHFKSELLANRDNKLSVSKRT